MRLFFVLLIFLLATSAKAQFFFDFTPKQQNTEQRRKEYVPPSFKGGEEALKAYQKKNFKRPAVHEQVDGRIVIAVIVNKKGSVEEVQVVRTLTRLLDAEAMRVCKNMKFRPATYGKEKVRGRIDITFPIRNGRLSFFDLPTTDV